MPRTANRLNDLAVKRAAGKDIHAHGFRALFSTHVAESGKSPDNVKEAAPAHGKRGIEAAYDRATHYPERAKLMQWWADEIGSAVRGADVIPIKSNAAWAHLATLPIARIGH